MTRVCRLAEEAAQVEADVVVATSFSRSAYDWQVGLMELSVIRNGNAVNRIPVRECAGAHQPLGAELAQLVKHGFWPVGLIAETSVTNVLAGYRTSSVLRSSQAEPGSTAGWVGPVEAVAVAAGAGG